MKVIRGSETWTTEITCSCKAVLEIEKSDLFVVNTAVGYAGETWDPRLRVKCCVCETTIDVTKATASGIRERMFSNARKGR